MATLAPPPTVTAARCPANGGGSRSTTTLAAQAVGILALQFVWFGALLPVLWADAGFPAVLDLIAGLRPLTRLDAFEDMARGAWGGYPRVALAASAVHTAVVVAGISIGTMIKRRLCSSGGSGGSKAGSTRSGDGSDGIGGGAQPVTEWAAAAAGAHTVSLAMGMVCAFLVRDVVFTAAAAAACRARARHAAGSALQVSLLATLAAAFFIAVQASLAFADMHGVECVARWSRQRALFEPPAVSVGGGGGDTPPSPSPAAAATGAGSFTAWFVLGAALVLPSPSSLLSRSGARVASCAHGVLRRARAFASRNLRLRPAPPFRPVTTNSGSEGGGSLLTPALVVAAASGLALYAGDQVKLLGPAAAAGFEGAAAGLAQWRTVGPAAWKFLFDKFSRNQLYFLTLPVLLLSEVPLWLFTMLDLLKLKRADKYRIHYSKIEASRPRLYPTSEELHKAFRVHVVNFFGLYCSVFVIGVGFSIFSGIVPYSFAEELPSLGRWVAEFLFCSFTADVLFYVIHRAVHSKGLYHLHKMHHEWVYPIALSHHYKEPFEAAIFMLPPILPPVLLGSHITLVWAIVLLTQLGGILGHSAFMIPVLSNKYTTWIPFLNSWYHDLHHLRFNVNYGAVWPLVDMLFGTYRTEPIIYINGVEAATATTAAAAIGDHLADSDGDDDDNDGVADNNPATGSRSGRFSTTAAATTAAVADLHRRRVESSGTAAETGATAAGTNTGPGTGTGTDASDHSGVVLVAESAEAASLEGALPPLPWFMRGWFPTEEKNFATGKAS